jgi:hypothetical protein
MAAPADPVPVSLLPRPGGCWLCDARCVLMGANPGDAALVLGHVAG